MAKLHDIDVEDYLLQSVDIEPLALEEEFIRLPPDLAYWNHQFADAVREYSRSKFLREQTAARLHTELREEIMYAAKEAAKTAIEDGATKSSVKVKSPTIADIEAAVLTNEEYVEAREREIEAEANKARLYGIVDAVRTKRDMLVQMGANRRAEMQGDPSIRQEARGAREAQNL